MTITNDLSALRTQAPLLSPAEQGEAAETRPDNEAAEAVRAPLRPGQGTLVDTSA